MDIRGLSNYILDKKCPHCKGQIKISLADIIEEKIIVCPNCHTDIRPVNAEEIAKKAQKKLQVVAKEIQDLLKNLKLETYSPFE